MSFEIFHERLPRQPKLPLNFHENFIYVISRAREIVGFAGSGPIFETVNRYIARQEAKKWVHKILYFSRFCNTQTDIVTCQKCSRLIIRYYLSSYCIIVTASNITKTRKLDRPTLLTGYAGRAVIIAKSLNNCI